MYKHGIPHEELLQLDPQQCPLQARELPSAQGFVQCHNARQHSGLKDQNTYIKYIKNLVTHCTSVFSLS